jgi:RNA polymerase sigma-70 factor (ECF subfamily)
LETSRLLERAIQALPRGYREVLLLRDVQQLSTEEAAATLEISVSAAKTRLRRARLMMREYLAPHFQKRRHGRLLDWFAGRRRTS